MKKFFTYFLIATCGFCLLSCSNNKGSNTLSDSSNKNVPAPIEKDSSKEDLQNNKMPQNNMNQEDMKKKGKHGDCQMEKCGCKDMCGCSEKCKCKTPGKKDCNKK